MSSADGAAAPGEDDADVRRASYVEAFTAARTAGDVEAMAAAALGLPSTQRFGSHPGQLPALPHEAYAAAVAPSTRCRLAAALARAWVYGGDSGRAGGFARDAEQLAMDLRDPVLLADVARLGGDFLLRMLIWCVSVRLRGGTRHGRRPCDGGTGRSWACSSWAPSSRGSCGRACPTVP